MGTTARRRFALRAMRRRPSSSTAARSRSRWCAPRSRRQRRAPPRASPRRRRQRRWASACASACRSLATRSLSMSASGGGVLPPRLRRRPRAPPPTPTMRKSRGLSRLSAARAPCSVTLASRQRHIPSSRVRAVRSRVPLPALVGAAVPSRISAAATPCFRTLTPSAYGTSGASS